MRPPLFNLLGPLGLSRASEEILQGTFQPPDNIDEETKNVIRHMKMNEDIIQNGPIRNGCTTTEFQKFWKTSREKVSSSISGIHNGHYISAAKDNYLSKLTAILSSLPWQMGVAPQR